MKSIFKGRVFDGFALRDLNIEPHKKIGKQFYVQKLAPGGAQVKHKFTENLFVYLYTQQFKCIVIRNFNETLHKQVLRLVVFNMRSVILLLN